MEQAKLNPNFSILRRSFYRALEKMVFTGPVLDVGGSTTAGYHELLNRDLKIDTANFDAAYGGNLFFDIEKRFPLNDGAYGSVLCLSVLEHVFDYANVVGESFRLLRSGGTAFYGVPYMFHIHSCPHDYFRYTDESLKRIFFDAGFRDISITPVAPGLLSLVYQTIEGPLSFLPDFCKNSIKYSWYWLDIILSKIFHQYRTAAVRIPLGYVVVAKKD